MKKTLHGSATLLLLVWAGFMACKSTDEGVDAAAGAAGEPGFSLGIGDGGEAGASSGGSAGSGDTGIQIDDTKCTLKGLGKCGVTSVEATYSTANVLLVIDKSGSMTDQPPGFDLNKWDALNAALALALPEVADEMNFGLVLYPYSTTAEIPLDCELNCCEVPPGEAAVAVPIEAGKTGVPKIIDAVSGTFPGGGTPTAPALASALEYFTTGAGATLVGEKYVLLATDGGPNCNGANTCEAEQCTINLDDQCTTANSNCCEDDGKLCLDDLAVVEQITALKEAGIPTFVVGIPGTEAYASYLDSFAVAGGMPNTAGSTDYYAVSATGGVEGLTATFTDITTHLVRSCEVDLKEVPPDDKLVNVAVDCEVVPYEEGAGWEINPDDRTQLEIKGPTCDWIKQQGVRRVDIVYGCPMIR